MKSYCGDFRLSGDVLGESPFGQIRDDVVPVPPSDVFGDRVAFFAEIDGRFGEMISDKIGCFQAAFMVSFSQKQDTLSCPVLSCPVLSCPVLSCPVLSCHPCIPLVYYITN